MCNINHIICNHIICNINAYTYIYKSWKLLHTENCLSVSGLYSSIFNIEHFLLRSSQPRFSYCSQIVEHFILID